MRRWRWMILCALPAWWATGQATRATVPATTQPIGASDLLKPPFEMAMIATIDRPRHWIGRAASPVYLPASRYAMLMAARDAAIELADAKDALDAVDALADVFDLDRIKLAHQTLDAVAAKASAPEDFAMLARLGMKTVDRQLATAASSADYTEADRLAAAASAWALASHDATLQVKAQGWNHEVAWICDQAEHISPEINRLRTQPDDPDANLAFGKLLCFDQDLWTRGLPHLAKGADTGLAGLANRELSQQDDPQSWGQLADGWWDQSRLTDGVAQMHLQLHACRWYAKSLPHAIGPRRALIERRAAEAGLTVTDLDKLRETAEYPERDSLR